MRGYDISRGAIASTIGHDSHNVCVVGDNPADMLAAVRAVGQGGHVLVRDGEVMAKVDLPLGGLMSDKTAEEVAPRARRLRRRGAATQRSTVLDPIMGVIFLPLPVIPALRIRPEGVFDVSAMSYV